jgi:hypothetical protein
MTILADPLPPTKQVPECGKYSLLGRNTRPREGSELRGLPKVSPFHAATVLCVRTGPPLRMPLSPTARPFIDDADAPTRTCSSDRLPYDCQRGSITTARGRAMKLAKKEKDDKPRRAERRSSHRTQWAAQFAVASELCKRGYEVAFTMGNHPSVDLLVNSPNQVAFSVDVKGLYKKNFWAVHAKATKHNLFYILAFVPDEGKNRFFILTQDGVNKAIEADETLARTRAVEKGRSVEKIGNFPGIAWGQAQASENAWDILPK